MMTTLKNLMQMKSLNFRKRFFAVMKGYNAKSMSRILRRVGAQRTRTEYGSIYRLTRLAKVNSNSSTGKQSEIQQVA